MKPGSKKNTSRTAQIVVDARLIIDTWKLQYFNDTRKQYRDATNFYYYQSEILRKLMYQFKDEPAKQHHRYINDLINQINFILSI